MSHWRGFFFAVESEKKTQKFVFIFWGSLFFFWKTKHFPSRMAEEKKKIGSGSANVGQKKKKKKVHGPGRETNDEERDGFVTYLGKRRKKSLLLWLTKNGIDKKMHLTCSCVTRHLFFVELLLNTGGKKKITTRQVKVKNYRKIKIFAILEPIRKKKVWFFFLQFVLIYFFF